MSRAHALTTVHAWDAPTHDASRTALGLAIVLALLVAAWSFAAHGGDQAASDEIAQLGD